MQIDNGLFLLIKSLSPSEKRYFKVFANRHVIGEQNEYVLLFNSIDIQTESGVYNEKALIQDLKRKGCDLALPAAKSYLYGLLLRSMRQFSDENNMQRQLEARLHDIRFLLDKGLTNKAKALLRKAQKLARLYDKPQLLLELFAIERLILRMKQAKHTQQLFKAIEREEDLAIRRWKVELDLLRLYDQIHVRIRTDQQLSLKQADLIKEFLHHPLLKKTSSLHTFGAEVFRLNILADIWLLSDKREKARTAQLQLVNHYEKNPHQQSDDILRYINVLNNYLNSCFKLGVFTDFPTILAKMKALATLSREVRYQIFRNGVYMELLYYLNTRRIQDGLLLVPEIEKGLHQFEKKLPISRLLTFRYNLVVLLFLNEHYSTAAKNLARIREQEYPDVRRDIQHAARFFQILLHFELSNLDLVESLLRSTSRYLRDQDFQMGYEQWLILIFKHILNEANPRSRKKLFNQFRIEHQNMAPTHAKALLFEEIGIWLESKASGKSLKQVFLAS